MFFGQKVIKKMSSANIFMLLTGTGFLLTVLLIWRISVSQTVVQDPSPPSKFLLTVERLKENLDREPSDQLVAGLVSHRGFHYPSVDLKRPIENTLPAYEHAWAAGIRYCECDVMLTKDGEIVLSHDVDLKRLALHPDQVTKTISESSFNADLEYLSLKDGSRVPRLSEVLSAAKRVNRFSKLVVEIKGNNLDLPVKLAATLLSDLGERVSVVMSFSLPSVKEFAKLNVRRSKLITMLLLVQRESNDGSLVFDLNTFYGGLDRTLKENNIDGIYVEYDPVFLLDVRFSELCKRYTVGVWGLAKDSKSAAMELLNLGVKFVNSDLNDDFFRA
jgi:glycerophosphoryl diester phosphodiesterase